MNANQVRQMFAAMDHSADVDYARKELATMRISDYDRWATQGPPDEDDEIDTAADGDELKRKLESLTPGGSEFYDSPDRCIEWVKERLSTTTKIAGERNELREELAAERHARTQERAQADARIAELEAELKAAKEWIEAVPVNAIEYMRGNSTCAHFPTPQGYWERQDLINAWLDALAESEAV